MAIPLILAMTGAEIRKFPPLPAKIAWLACHFSSSEPGLSNLPTALPPGSTLIVDDQLPVCDHDPDRILTQLSAVSPERVLLDFQRPPSPQAVAIAQALVQAAPCPMAVTPPFGDGLSCPVFLPPVPPHVPIVDYLHPWASREIWLELALDATEINVTAAGSTVTSLLHAEPKENAHTDRMLHCHYKITQEPDSLRFYCYRTREDITKLLDAPLPPNLTHALGLFQELG